MIKQLVIGVMWLFCFSISIGVQANIFDGDEKVVYAFTDEPIDVVIPSTAKDLEILEACIEGIRYNGSNIRRIIVVSKTPLTDEAEWYDEKLYPFSKYDIALWLKKGDQQAAECFMAEPSSRVGWYYQQLLKLYATFVIPDISANVLVLDSDTVFIKPVSFQSEASAGLYNPSGEYWLPYFHHANRLIPGFKRLFPEYSGISHHMLLQRCVLEDLFAIVKDIHQKDTHQMEFWQAFCSCVDPEELLSSSSGASEYEIYFNFVFARTDQVAIRHLKRADVPTLEWLPLCQRCNCDYFSCHDWMRAYGPPTAKDY